jgi:hypothetical protein
VQTDTVADEVTCGTLVVSSMTEVYGTTIWVSHGVWSRGDNLLGRGRGVRLGVVICRWNPVGDWVVDGLGLVDLSRLLVYRALRG